MLTNLNFGLEESLLLTKVYLAWYVSKFRREQRTEFQCPLCGKVGAVEVFQPRLVIFRAEPSIDASIGTFVPSKCVSSLVPRQSSTNFSMTDPGAMNNHI